MARRTTKFVNGEFYHIYNRGCGRERIFQSSENFRFLQRLLREYSSTTEVSIIAYTLMPNHYHLVLRQDGEFSAGMFVQRLFNKYVKAFNKMFSRSGTLFEGPFKSRQVEDEAYLVYLCRYVHRNPLDAGLVTKIEEWEFSDYAEWIHPQRVVESRAVRLFPRFFKSPLDYQQFVLAAEIPPEIMAKLRGLDD